MTTIAFIGVSGTGKSTLMRYVAERYGLSINPVGSRAIAKEMGFYNQLTDEGQPYDVDRACGRCYEHAEDVIRAQGIWEVANSAIGCDRGPHSKYGTVRPIFQAKLAEAKIAWETRAAENADHAEANDVWEWSGTYVPNHPERTSLVGKPLPRGFVTDRTPLDDLAYALMHCPEVVTKAFRDRAYAHTKTYDVIYYCPLAAGQWLASDAARVSDEQDPTYHWRCDVLLKGLLFDSSTSYVDIYEQGLDERKAHVVASLDAITARRAR
jgi:hypothetical protein